MEYKRLQKRIDKLIGLLKDDSYYSSEKRFLEENPFLIPVIEETIEKLKQLFQLDKFRLVLLELKEGGEDYILYLEVYTKHPLDAFHFAPVFKEKWWNVNKHRAREKLHIVSLSEESI